MKTKDTNDDLRIFVTTVQLALLKRFAFPGSERVLEGAVSSDDGIELIGTRREFDDLVGWVAGEANHARRGRAVRRTEILDDIADQLEDVLASC